MTRIKRLEMKGFKSFANKTEIMMGDGFNCVLGPNGSGKSNVLDALCFVLGKGSAKGLRAEKSANLIYNGGKKKQPAKQGEVTIVFDNSIGIFGDTPELMITRIVMKSGQSKYKINGKSSTRQEILDMLSRDKINPDGYNIILQGDINHLIEMSTNERRQIIEEIAGISIYEDKKAKAIRELDRVEEKLNEADIVLAERKTYLRELKKERNQALKFKELDEKIKRNKCTLLTIKKKHKDAELAKFESQVSKHKSELDKFGEKRAKLEAEIEERRKKLDDISKEVERRGEKEQVQLHKEIEAMKVEFAVNKQRVDTLEGELIKLDDRKDELISTNKELFDKIKHIEDERKDLGKRIKTREESVAKLDARLGQFRKKHKMEDATGLDDELDSIDKEAETLQDELSKLREEQQELLREKDKVEIKLEQIDEKIAKVAGIEKEHKKELDVLKNKKEQFKKATKELSTALNDDSSLVAQLQNARGKALSRKEELAKLQAKQSSIQERIAGGHAITAILALKSKGTIKGIHGTVASLGKVKEDYSLALEIAAGPRVNSIVVDTDEVAAKCIRHLRDNRLGVATFLPLNKLRAPGESSIKAGGAVIGLASKLVEYQTQYAKVFQYVFGSTVVMKDIDSARKLGVGKARMVTLNGDLLETSGAMSGGFRNKERRGIGFQQKETSEKIEKLETEVMDAEAVIAKLEKKRDDNEELITRLRELKAGLEGEIIKSEKSLHLDSADIGLSKDEKKKLKDDLAGFEKQLDDIISAVSEKTGALGQMKIRKQQLRDQLSALRSPTVLAEMNSFEEKKQELKQEIAELQGELRTSESEVKNILGPETEKVQGILKQHDKEKATFEQEKKGLTIKLKEEEKALKEKEKASAKFFSQFKELFAKRNKLEDEVRERETTIKEREFKVREMEQKNTGISLEVARLRAELAGVNEELKHYEGVDPYKKSEKSEEDIQLEVREFERLVESIGAVNMKALEIYDQVETEYNSLIEKKDKLGSEREDVLVMINEIDAKKKELFMKTFIVVNENFKHFFMQLSTKGDAFLELEDEQDPFNGGLTIKVKLTGKKFLDIRSLSGGEKTMTALAFLFAVQEHEPASFYIMDEVDAALDKHNSEKLAKLIRQYCARAQYIIISHNDAIISEADNLFGVSMNEHGMSKITSLKI
ncbi:chromosome segregation protein SMC [Candidatus Woesearchaeota archaeon]|nr:chromosome segregation protein SMC [Candidatus Woesearchaeota archaeon]